MKKSRSNKVARGAADTETCGSDRLERWWALLEREIADACKRFWEATPERRKIEAKRLQKKVMF
jgi:hypothetical protein